MISKPYVEKGDIIIWLSKAKSVCIPSQKYLRKKAHPETHRTKPTIKHGLCAVSWGAMFAAGS